MCRFRCEEKAVFPVASCDGKVRNFWDAHDYRATARCIGSGSVPHVLDGRLPKQFLHPLLNCLWLSVSRNTDEPMLFSDNCKVSIEENRCIFWYFWYWCKCYYLSMVCLYWDLHTECCEETHIDTGAKEDLVDTKTCTAHKLNTPYLIVLNVYVFDRCMDAPTTKLAEPRCERLG